MHRRHGVRTYPTRQGSSGVRRIQVIFVADERATGRGLRARRAQLRRQEFVVDTSVGRTDAPDALPVAATPNPLSVREREVLGMLARGLPNKEIARLLFITDRTVKWHAQAIYRKLDVANRTEAVCVALRRGIVALDTSLPSASDAA